MDLSFIYKSLKLTLLMSAALAIACLHHFGSRFSLGMVSGCVWNALNILLFIRLSKAITQAVPKRRNIFLLALFKFAGLYTAGYFMVSRGGFSLYGICLGFSLFFLVIFCQSIVRVLVLNQRIGYVRQ